MLKSNHGEDTFFDSLDSFRSCNSLLFPEEEEEEVSSLSTTSSSSCEVVELGYQIWNSEPGCVLERRERFLREMGFSELVNANDNLALERIAQGSGVVTSSSSCPFSNRGGGEASCSGRDLDEENKFLASKMRQCRSSRRITIYEPDKKFQQHLPNGQLLVIREATANGDKKQVQEHTTNKKRLKSWWNRFVQKTMKEGMMMRKPGGPTKDRKAPMANRMKVGYNRKRCMEFSAVYMGQQIQAHKGFIWTMKFSPDGQYLASGGEDGVVRIWRVSSTDASCKYFTAKDTSTLVDKSKGRKLIPGRKISKPASVIIPQKVFMIDESPLHEFYGHTDDVLDLCWSKSNCLLSSSKDETVRLWQVGSEECLQVFHHNNYVTCIQFNPVDDRYFISGSIDGKVRVWGISESRVVNWADVRDIITAICYQPDGQGFIVGSNSGHCRFYDASGNHLQLDAQICVQGRKKSSLNRITGFQFSPEAAQKVMITSADSKVRIFDGLDVIHKYRGLRKSGSQMSASFTSNGRHIISVGEDSRVYVWNYDGLCAASSKQAKSIRSCEHFFFEGVSVAVPWLGMEQEQVKPNLQNSSYTLDRSVTSSLPRDSARFSLSSWFSMNGRLRGLATWPEEKLPLWSVPVELDDHQHNHQQDQEHHYHQDRQQKQQFHKRPTALSSTWGLVIVTGGCDGMIRTFHNYGLPVRL